ncbi:MAG: DUF3800 domain-containing protein [Candidatus Pacebacteria bacterium]|nr:DUF3800 domain-containing protein [Candidatus Paceibacterota bacterium]
MFIFIDESGNFIRDKNRYFVVGGFVTGDQRRTAKAFRKWQKTKFPKRIRYKNEVKFNDSGLNDKLRLKTLSYFTKYDIRIFYTFLKVENIPAEYRKKKGIETGLLYAEVVAKTLDLLLPTTDLEFRVFRDKRNLQGLTQVRFHKMLKLDLLPKLSPKSLFQIEAVDSVTSYNIQIADWICGALFRYYNNRKNGENFFITLKNSIIVSEELFKDYLVNKKSR